MEAYQNNASTAVFSEQPGNPFGCDRTSKVSGLSLRYIYCVRLSEHYDE